MATKPRRSAAAQASKQPAVPHGPSEGKGKPAARKQTQAAAANPPAAKTHRKPPAATRPPKPSRGAAVSEAPVAQSAEQPPRKVPVGGSIPSRGTSTLSAEIRAAAAHGFRFYVYSLSDADGVFYVGKGQRNRLLMHGKPGDTANAAKSLRMLSAGTSVERSVIAYYRDERDALDHERALIADSRDSLTNVADGGAPQDPRDRASDIAAGMLARLKPIEQIRPEFREAFCLVRAEIEREVIDPSPSSISVDARSALTFGYGETHHQSRRQTTDVGVSAR